MNLANLSTKRQWIAELARRKPRGVRPRMAGEWTPVRFGDDCVMAYETHHDARRVREVLGKRLARYGLTLHPDKPRFVGFRRGRKGGTHHPDCAEPPFDFLGF